MTKDSTMSDDDIAQLLDAVASDYGNHAESCELIRKEFFGAAEALIAEGPGIAGCLQGFKHGDGIGIDVVVDRIEAKLKHVFDRFFDISVAAAGFFEKAGTRMLASESRYNNWATSQRTYTFNLKELMMSESNSANTYPSAFIDDDYTRTALISETEGFHGPIVIEYKPMLTAGRARVLKQLSQASAGDEKSVERGERIAAETMAKHLVSWGVVDRLGKPVEIIAANLGRIDPHLSAKIFKVVVGLEKPEPVVDFEN